MRMWAALLPVRRGSLQARKASGSGTVPADGSGVSRGGRHVDVTVGPITSQGVGNAAKMIVQELLGVTALSQTC